MSSTDRQDVGQILDVDPEQLAQLLGQSADGTAQLIDEHGNTITLTAEQFAEAGLSLQLQEGQYIQSENGEIYIFESDAQRANQQSTDVATSQSVSTSIIRDTVPPKHIASRQTVTSVPASHLMRAPPTMPPTGAVDPNQQQRLLEEYRRMLREREARLNEIEQKLKETSDQNVLMAHALVNTCKNQDVEVVIQNADGHSAKRQLVSVRKSGPGEMVPDGAYVVTGQGGDTHIVTAGQQKIVKESYPPPQPQAFPILPSFRRPTDAFQLGFLPYPCDQCPRRFAQEIQLKRHLEMAHAKRRPFFCQYCNRDLYLSSDLHFQGHMRMQHKQEMENEANATQAGASGFLGSGIIPRQEVEKEPDWEAIYRTKEATEEVAPVEGGEFKCTLCNKEYASMKGLKKHAKDEHNVLIDEDKDENADQFKCQQCTKSFSKEEFLDKHRLAHTNEFAFSCQYCPGRKFRWKENLLKHLNWHMERMPFKCAFCNQGFPSQIRLDLHQKSRHGHSREGSSGMALPANQLQRDHACPICQKSFFDKEVLTKHMRIHGGTVYPCPECDKKFISETFLRNHMTVHTQIRDFTCEKCGKFFISASLLKAHRYVHGERPYKCRSCRRTFRRIYDLRSHEKMHTDLKQHICEVCGRNFRNKATLELHLRVHQGLKPFQCSSCRKTFSRIEHLQTHVNAHQGIKPFPCAQCDNAFFTAEHLEQHKALHKPGKKPFECGTCGRAFLKRHHLIKHLKCHTTNANMQYLIFWEKGGILQEATIVSDNAGQEAFMDLEDIQQQQLEDQAYQEEHRFAQHPVSTATARKQPSKNGAVGLAQELAQDFEKPMPKKEKVANSSGGGQAETSRATAAAGSEQILDPNTLLALAEAQDDDGTIYISGENLQALAERGVVFSYQDEN